MGGTNNEQKIINDGDGKVKMMTSTMRMISTTVMMTMVMRIGTSEDVAIGLDRDAADMDTNDMNFDDADGYDEIDSKDHNLDHFFPQHS